VGGHQNGVELDHVLFAVTDLADAARAIEAELGLMAIGGGRHPSWGTANRIVPLGDAYLELVAVVDPTVAMDSPFGRWVTGSQSDGIRPVGWAVRTQELDEVASRLDLEVEAGSRTGQDEVVSWRLAGVAEAATEPALPFFIEWAPGTRLPGQADHVHAFGEVTIAEIRLSGDPLQIQRWLGADQVPIDIRPGASAITSVVLRSTSGDQVILGTTED
jgi:hypothetical protein